MIYREGKFKVDRARLLNWAGLSGSLDFIILKNAKKNLLEGDEHIVSTKDVLEYMRVIPGHLVIGLTDSDQVHYENVEVILENRSKDDYYKPNKNWKD